LPAIAAAMAEPAPILAVKKIACFISPHGFGHATRTIAVLEALKRLHLDCHAHLFTTVPETLFAASLADFTYHVEPVDIGLVQSSALTVDIPATCAQLDRLLPYSADRLAELGDRCAGCSIILCDIAPLGIAVGRLTGITTVLLENFTWDWIYQPYCQKYPELQRHARFLGNLFQRADYRIQTEPLCREARRDVVCGPIFRRLRMASDKIRAVLNVGDRSLILITLGGIPQQLPELRRVEEQSDLFFVIAGQPHTEQVAENCLLLQRDTDLSHPDLIGAADLVVCKAGYSTIAECCLAGARVLVIGRDDYPESQPLQRYVQRVLAGVPITAELYERGGWLPLARELLSRQKPAPATENGADRVAAFLSGLM